MKKIIYAFMLTAFVVVACQKENVSETKNANANGTSGSITRFASHNNYLYALDQNKIKVYDIANGASPTLVNTVITDYGLETITVYDGTIFIGSRTALYILDITNPASPVILSKTEREGELAGGCDPVAVKNNYAFSTVKIIENVCGVINTSSRLLVYDVTDKNNPVLVNEYNMNIPNGLGYKDNTLFVCDEGSDVIMMFDITNPVNTSFSSTFPLTDPVDLIVDGNKMVVSTKTGFSFYDITDLNNIQPKGTIEIH